MSEAILVVGSRQWCASSNIKDKLSNSRCSRGNGKNVQGCFQLPLQMRVRTTTAGYLPEAKYVHRTIRSSQCTSMDIVMFKSANEYVIRTTVFDMRPYILVTFEMFLQAGRRTGKSQPNKTTTLHTRAGQFGSGMSRSGRSTTRPIRV